MISFTAVPSVYNKNKLLQFTMERILDLEACLVLEKEVLQLFQNFNEILELVVLSFDEWKKNRVLPQ